MAHKEQSSEFSGEGDYWGDIPCNVCHSTDPRHDDKAVICDGCDCVFHTFCIDLDAVPTDDPWFCAECKQQQAAATRCIYKEDLSDFDEEAEIPDNAFTKHRESSDDQEWRPSKEPEETHRRKSSVGAQDMQMTCRSDGGEAWVFTFSRKRKRSDSCGEKDKYEIIRDINGEQMWKFTFSPRKRRKIAL